MQSIIPILKRGLLVGIATFLTVGILPITAFADDPVTPACVPIGSDQAGVHKPVGADASMYVYNCATNVWENAHFSYDPVTSQVISKDPFIATYNPTTGLYDTTLWTYDAPTHSYV